MISQRDYFILHQIILGIEENVRKMNCGENAAEKMREEFIGYIEGLDDVVKDLTEREK